MLPGRKNVVMSFWGGQSEGLGVRITIMACFLCISLTVVTLYLVSVIVVDFKGYGRPFITKDLGWHTKTSSFCMIMSGPKLPARLVTGYDTMVGRIWTIHATVWCRISISLDPFRSIWQANTLQKKQTWSALSPSSYRHDTNLSMTGCRPSHSGANSCMALVSMWISHDYQLLPMCHVYT
jgi:hypothetical protein